MKVTAEISQVVTLADGVYGFDIDFSDNEYLLVYSTNSLLKALSVRSLVLDRVRKHLSCLKDNTLTLSDIEGLEAISK